MSVVVALLGVDGSRFDCPVVAVDTSRSSSLETESADEKRQARPSREDCEASPGTDGQGGEDGRPLDRQTGGAGAHSFDESLPVGVAGDMGGERKQVEEAEHGGRGRCRGRGRVA